MLGDVTPRFSRPGVNSAHGGGGHGDDSSSSGGGERLRERTTHAGRAAAQSSSSSSTSEQQLIPIFSPLVQRLVLLLILGIMTLSSSVALAAASSLVRSPSSYLRSAASAAAASSSSAVLTASRDHHHHQHTHQPAHHQTLAHPQSATPDKMQALIDLYCRGSLLHDVQVNHVFADSKHFVDMPVKPTSSAAAIPDEYRAYLEQIGPQWMLMEQKERILLLKVFLDQHFDAPGSDMAAVVPHDYQEDAPPPAIAAITSPTFQEWAFQLHKLWKLLGRVPLENVTSSFLHATPVADPELERTQNVLVVPGGRFRESYYWDSYWIVEGLLVSNMKRTARGVVNNFLEYVAEYGFVPNGGRIYYLSRSQPPLLSDMVKLVAEAGKPDAAPGSHDAKTVDLDYLRAVVPILEKEYAFWMQLGPSSHAVEIEAPVRRRRSSSAAMPTTTTTAADATTEPPKRFILNRYVAHADEPRPESYREDFHDATLAFKHTHGLDHADIAAKKSHLYNDIIAAAESGWDFTSRWFKDGKTMAAIDTSNVVPVDLNVMMHRVERNLAHFHTLLGDASAAALFTRAAAVRADAIHTLLWSNKTQSWHDYFLDTHTLSPIVAVSNYAPLWSDGLVDTTDPEAVENIIESFRSSGLIQVGGIQATTAVTGQQWDAPNAWPPSQDMVIEGLLALKSSKQAQHLARDLMRTWVKAGYVAWQKTGLMFEKYNATTLGGIGNGGEYIPQFGFGWTNGVILKYLAKHQHLLAGVDTESSSHA